MSLASRIYEDPNRHARPASLELGDHAAIFHGYQEFSLTREAIRVLPHDEALATKRRVLDPFLSRRYLAGRSVLDLGANGGFFSFWSLLSGATRAVAVDMDPEYVRMMEEARDRIGFGALETAKANVVDWEQPADVVLALALIHWIYSCTALYGTLDASVGKLAALTRYLLLVEWVGPEDHAVESFRHIEYNRDVVRGPYTLEAFEDALSHHFARWERIGEITPSRAMYAAFVTRNELDLSSPLPFAFPEETAIYSRRLARHDGVEWWSRIYDTGDAVHKQATGDLAAREGRILARLRGPAFPRVLASRAGPGGSSILSLERIEGVPLREAAAEIAAAPQRFAAFARDCLGILEALRREGIEHRDIRADNLIVRDGRPVLIDFGWAVAPGEGCFAPRWLGGPGRPPDGTFDDVYSLGAMLREVAGGALGGFDGLVGLMEAREADLRVTDLGVLRTLLDVAEARA